MIETEYGMCYENVAPPPFEDFRGFIEAKRFWCLNEESLIKTWNFLQDRGWKTKYGTVTKDWFGYCLYWYDKINDSYK